MEGNQRPNFRRVVRRRGAGAGLWYVFATLGDFALEREREARRAAPDPEFDALERDLREALGDNYSRLVTNMNTILSFPALFDELDASVAYEQIEKILAPHPDLSERFFARFAPWCEMRMTAYLYGVPRLPWRRARAIRRLLSRRSPESAGSLPG